MSATAILVDKIDEQIHDVEERLSTFNAGVVTPLKVIYSVSPIDIPFVALNLTYMF
jgi:hypothetical protein